MKIFVFGSLLSQDVLNIVLGEHHICLDELPVKEIKNYQAYYVENEEYPMLLKKEHEVLSGKIITIDNKEHLDRLTYYEGEENPLKIISTDDSLYAFLADSTLTPGPKKWDLNDWLQSPTYKDFLERVKKFMSQIELGLDNW